MEERRRLWRCGGRRRNAPGSVIARGRSRARCDDARGATTPDARARAYRDRARDGVRRAVVAFARATDARFVDPITYIAIRTPRRRRFAHAAFPAPSRERARHSPPRSRERKHRRSSRAASHALASPHGASLASSLAPPAASPVGARTGKPTFIPSAHNAAFGGRPRRSDARAPRPTPGLLAARFLFPRPRAFATPTRANGFALARSRRGPPRVDARSAPSRQDARVPGAFRPRAFSRFDRSPRSPPRSRP